MTSALKLISCTLKSITRILILLASCLPTLLYPLDFNDFIEFIQNRRAFSPIHEYNQFFKVNLKDEKSLEEDMAIRLKQYFKGIRQCEKGIYQYALPYPWSKAIIFFASTTIEGTFNDHCQLMSVSPVLTKEDFQGVCRFSKADRALFTDKAAEHFIYSRMSIDFQNPSEIEKTLGRACHTEMGHDVFKHIYRAFRPATVKREIPK